tara:strand:- start:50 stop:919 length:870 start_codon:yes stop_codon:yes gene_type:complete
MLSDAYYDMNARLSYMDMLGVNRQILSFPGLFGVDSLPIGDCADLLAGFNDHVAGIAGARPTRFSGLAALPLADMDEAVREYRRARLDLGLVGAILPVNLLVSVDHAASLAPVFAAAQELGGHLFVHPGRRADEVPPAGTAQKPSPYVDNISARLALAVQDRCAAAMVTLVFSDFLEAYPDVSLHVANLGGTLPMVVERMDQVTLTRTPGDSAPSSFLRRVHVDCSSLGPRAIEIAAAFYGADKILFGSDCPIFMTDWSLDAVANTRLCDADKHAIREGNAARLFKTLL